MKRPPSLFACLLVCASATAQTVTLIGDDFNSPALDAAKWTTVTQGIPGASVVQENGVVAMTDGGYLRSNQQVDPLVVGEIHIHGRWQFQAVSAGGNGVGVLQILTRTDAQPDLNNNYQASNGLEFNLWLGGASDANPGVCVIGTRGSAIQVGTNTVNGVIHWTQDAWYEFDIFDSGPHASWTVHEVSDPTNSVSVSCDVVANAQSLNYIVAHSREYIGGSNVSLLDDISVLVPDCDSNGTPDKMEITANPMLDRNGNGILDTCECVVSSYCTAAPNSVSASGALMGNAGTVSIAQNNLTLLCSHCPPNASGVFFYGPQQTQVAFGNGYRCVAGPITRLGLTVAGPTGIAAKSVNYPTLLPTASITAGSTWNFQFWYRNPAAGGAGFNLSNGLSIRFCP